MTLTDKQCDLLQTAATRFFGNVLPAAAVREPSEEAEITEEHATCEASPGKSRKLRTGTKQATIIDMLKRAQGASLQQIMDVTGWKMHTTRAVLSRTIQKDLGFPLTSEKTGDGDRIYRIV